MNATLIISPTLQVCPLSWPSNCESLSHSQCKIIIIVLAQMPDTCSHISSPREVKQRVRMISLNPQVSFHQNFQNLHWQGNKNYTCNSNPDTEFYHRKKKNPNPRDAEWRYSAQNSAVLPINTEITRSNLKNDIAQEALQETLTSKLPVVQSLRIRHACILWSVQKIIRCFVMERVPSGGSLS